MERRVQQISIKIDRIGIESQDLRTNCGFSSTLKTSFVIWGFQESDFVADECGIRWRHWDNVRTFWQGLQWGNWLLRVCYLFWIWGWISRSYWGFGKNVRKGACLWRDEEWREIFIDFNGAVIRWKQMPKCISIDFPNLNLILWFMWAVSWYKMIVKTIFMPVPW